MNWKYGKYSVALFSLTFVFGLATGACGQSQGVPQPPVGTSDSSHTKGQDDASARLESLANALSGKWRLSVKFEPTAEMPSGLTGTGEETWHRGPGGYTLIEEEQIPMPGGEGYLLGIIWWDARSNRFQGIECNNRLPFTCDLKGALSDITITWDGKTFAIEELETHNGRKTIWHEVWSNITPTSFVQTGDVTQPDGSTTRFMTLQGSKE
jgi:hypothetical protein